MENNKDTKTNSCTPIKIDVDRTIDLVAFFLTPVDIWHIVRMRRQHGGAQTYAENSQIIRAYDKIMGREKREHKERNETATRE